MRTGILASLSGSIPVFAAVSFGLAPVRQAAAHRNRDMHFVMVNDYIVARPCNVVWDAVM
jgi:hypothetical protein